MASADLKRIRLSYLQSPKCALLRDKPFRRSFLEVFVVERGKSRVGDADFLADDVRPQLERLTKYRGIRGLRMKLHWRENPQYRFPAEHIATIVRETINLVLSVPCSARIFPFRNFGPNIRIWSRLTATRSRRWARRRAAPSSTIRRPGFTGFDAGNGQAFSKRAAQPVLYGLSSLPQGHAGATDRLFAAAGRRSGTDYSVVGLRHASQPHGAIVHLRRRR